MKLSTAKIILKLIEDVSINGSEFKDKKVLKELHEENIVHVHKLTPNRSKIKLVNKDLLYQFLDTKYSIKNIEKLIYVKQKKDVSREELSNIIGDTKAKRTNVQTGLYINCFEKIKIQVDDEDYILNPTPNGSIFINHLSKMKIDKNILLVIVENFENLLKIEKQKYLFNSHNKTIFIFRNTSLYRFIDDITNNYLYFGDIDLAGISIFLHDIRPKTKAKGKFFIPENIEILLENSDSKLYFKQYEKFKNLNSNEPYIDKLIKCIHKFKTTVEQESFIS